MAKEKFNLKSLLNERSVVPDMGEGTQVEKQDFEVKMLDVFDLVPSKENFYNTSEIEDMKQSIELLGIEQNLIIKEIESGKYKVLAGHRRRVASIKLVEEGKEKYRWVPCRIKTTTNEILDRLTIVMTNSTQRELKDWEKMRQALEIEELVIELKKEAGIPGRTRDLLAEITNTSPTQLGRYKAIQNNLCEELMEVFKSGEIGFSVAYEASSLSHQGQQKSLEILNKNGSLVLSDVKQIKKSEEESRPIKGQINLFNPSNESYIEKELKDEFHESKEYEKLQQEVEVINEYIEDLEKEELKSEEIYLEQQEQQQEEFQEEQQSNMIIIEEHQEENEDGCGLVSQGELVVKNRLLKTDIRVIQRPVYVQFQCPYCEEEIEIGYKDFCIDVGEHCDWSYSKIECHECGKTIKIDNVDWD